MTIVREIMTDFAVTLNEDRTVADAARLLADLDIGSVPVVGPDDRLRGVVTDRDIVIRVLAEDQDPATTTVGAIVGGEPVVAHAQDDVEHVLQTMGEHRVRRLPVLDDDVVIGVVALADVARAMPERRVGEVLGAISEPNGGGAASPGDAPTGDDAAGAAPVPSTEPAPASAVGDVDPAALDVVPDAPATAEGWEGRTEDRAADEAGVHDDDERDVVDLILARHADIRAQFEAVASADREDGELQVRFDELVRMLAVHEAVEEELIHPLAQDRLSEGESIVGERLAEEGEAKRTLAMLHELGVAHPEFDARFATFAQDVLAHAEAEEREELPALREALTQEHLRALARLWLAAEAIAPTRPHPVVGETGLANMLAGPPLAVFDRVRDAVRRVQRP
ncbi:MAG: CBS domain-containing protein [Candidatus Nanopelagicales bacterium]|nr:CBS domain-containing protein [Candidatus Nanopelagicales bacterium]